MAGDAKGARVPLEPEVQKMIGYQIKLGKLKDGDVGFIKVASDGTAITKRDTATATTVTVGNETNALQIGILALVFSGETYEVKNYNNYLDH